MQDETATIVFSVVGHALDVRARLDRGESPALGAEQATLERLLQHESESKRYADLGAELEIRYALACWLDELFIVNSPWESRWNEHKLEAAVFGTNDRAWKFWEKARRALTRPEGDVLEVYYLCVMLGFRGELAGEPDRLRAWSAAARARIEKAQGQAWAPPPELDPPTNVPPLHGRERFKAMVFRGGVALLALIPIAAILVAQHLRR